MRETRTRYAKGNVIEMALAGSVFFLAVLLPERGGMAAMLSGLFTPLGVTVGIWSVVYALLMVFCGYNLIPAVRNSPERGTFIERVGCLFMVACILNIGWIFASYYRLLLFSAGASILLLITLTIIYLRLQVGSACASRAETYLVQVPFGVYLGWVVMVAIANVSAALACIKWDGLSPQIWPLLGITIAVSTAVVVLVKKGDVWFSLVIAAALLGTFLDRLLGAGASERMLVTVAGTGAVMVAGAILYLVASGNRPGSRPFSPRT